VEGCGRSTASAVFRPPGRLHRAAEAFMNASNTSSGLLRGSILKQGRDQRPSANCRRRSARRR
jgi:hypothetical protein